MSGKNLPPEILDAISAPIRLEFKIVDTETGQVLAAYGTHKEALDALEKFRKARGFGAIARYKVQRLRSIVDDL